jgi:AcrR family transcriptional regulator
MSYCKMQGMAGTKRSYSSPRRAEQAARTRADVLAAAVELFGEHGWARTTITAVADRAQVSAETVYKTFGSKRNLLKAAMDFAIVGDDEAIAFADRAAFRASATTGSFEERLRAGFELAADAHERTAGVWRAIVEAAPSDPEIEAARVEIERARLSDSHRFMELALGRPADESTLAAAWILSGPDAYGKLTRELGLDRAGYVTTMVNAFLGLWGVDPHP